MNRRPARFSRPVWDAAFNGTHAREGLSQGLPPLGSSCTARYSSTERPGGGREQPQTGENHDDEKEKDEV